MKEPALDSGILLIYKPKDISSFGVVARARKMLGMRKVGHLGTLDPFAVGILPIVFGRGTRLTQYLMDHDKTYRVKIALGIATDTMDRDGTVVAKSVLSEERIRELTEEDCQEIRFTVDSLVGEQEQKPPMYSAVKVEGKPLYHYARRGEEVVRAARKIEVYSAELLEVKQDYSFYFPSDKTLILDIIIHCSKGTYIRVLADELGRSLGSFAYASELERAKVGSLSCDQAIELEQAESLFRNIDQNNRLWISMLKQSGHIISLEQAVTDFPALNLDYSQALQISSGMTIPGQEIIAIQTNRKTQQSGTQIDLCNTSVKAQLESMRSSAGNSLRKEVISLFWRGRLLALARFTEDDKIQPETVFITREELISEKRNEDS